jgi:hypothetical protein
VVNVSWCANPWHFYCGTRGKFLVHVINKFWQYKSSNTDKVKARDNAAFTFIQGSHSWLVHQFNQTAARNAAANKNINQKITRWATPKALRIFWLY